MKNALPYFTRLPNEYDVMMKEIKNTKFPKIFDQFIFQYYKFESSSNELELKRDVINFLKNYKFITYQTQEIIDQKCHTIICVEDHCLIIEFIEPNLICNILNKINSFLINVSDKSSTISQQINEEINSIYNEFQKEIEKNKFVKYLYKPIIAYIIRRNYFPSNYFNSQSFFNFDEYLFKKQNEVKIDFKENKKINKINQLFEFKESDFIRLRNISSSKSKIILLAFHCDSLCLVVMNEIDYTERKKIERQIDFYRHHSHRCMMKCYGFIQDEQYFIFINEFMSNGSIDEYMNGQKIENDFFYSFMAMNRIFQSIYYMHFNKLIHRDIKPSNVLVNHDGLPFLSDFEMVRHIDEKPLEKEKMTLDFASEKFSSPEQTGILKSEITYSTDIYSFDHLIYYLFEKKNINENTNIPQFSNTSVNIQNLIIKCIKFLPTDRSTIIEIKEKIIEYIKTYFYFEPSYLKKMIKITKKEFIDFFLNENNILIDQEQTNCKDFFTELIKEKDISAFMHIIGEKYKNGFFGHSEYIKAKEIFETSSKLGNSDSFISLGILHRDGAGVNKDYIKAREYFEISVQMNNSLGYILIGNLYIHGQGVEKSYEKAKYFYKKSAEMGNSEALVGLAFLYIRGNGVEKNVSKGLDYMKLSAKKDNPNACIYLGNIYLRGIIVKHNLAKSKKYYEKAANLGESEGFVGLGALYLRGLGVEKDFKKARELFEKSARLNNSNGYRRLGSMYTHRYGVKRNYQKAKEYFELSLKKGNIEAFVELGTLYLYGFSVKQNFEKQWNCSEWQKRKTVLTQLQE